MTAVNVDAWIRQAQEGDASAIEALYGYFVETIYRYVYYRVSNRHDAEDVTAEVFIKMLEGLPSYRIIGAPFEAWLYRIAAARVVDFRRRQRHRRADDLSEDLVAQDPRPEDQIEHALEMETLRTALSQLSDDEQTLLILRFVENKSHHETAAIMDKTPVAVKAMQHRALIRLASVLGSEDKVRHYLRGGGS